MDDLLEEFDPLTPASRRQSPPLFTPANIPQKSAESTSGNSSNTSEVHLPRTQTNVDPLDCNNLLISLDDNNISSTSLTNGHSNNNNNGNNNNNNNLGNISTNEGGSNGSKLIKDLDPVERSNIRRDELLSDWQSLSSTSHQPHHHKQQQQQQQHHHSYSPKSDNHSKQSTSKPQRSPPPRRLSGVMMAPSSERSPTSDPTISPNESHQYHSNTATDNNSSSSPQGTTDKQSTTSYFQFPITRLHTQSGTKSHPHPHTHTHPLPNPHPHPHLHHPQQNQHQRQSEFRNPPSRTLSGQSLGTSTPSTPFTPPDGAPGYTGEDKDWNKSRFQFDATKDLYSNEITFKGVHPGSNIILDEDLADAIRPSLPPRVRLSRTWSLLYSLDQHGVSLSTLYSRVAQGMSRSEANTGCLLVIEDEDGGVFGAYSNESFKRSESYYGSGECFLWKSIPFSGNDVRVGTTVKAYKWTGRNDYMVLSDSEFLSVGGGDGRYGLWIDSDLEQGVSSPCPAFMNDVLCSHTMKNGLRDRQEGRFTVVNIEVWKIGN